MEKTLNRLINEGQKDTLAHVLFEGRGKKEDGELELAFRRICDNQAKLTHPLTNKKGLKGFAPDFSNMSFEPRFLPKSINCTGLQIADLIARPIALKYLRPNQRNRAFDIIQRKLCAPQKVFPA